MRSFLVPHQVTERNNASKELAYVSINDSASVWEVNIAHSWKILPLELATWIEHQWSQGVKKSQLKDYVFVSIAGFCASPFDEWQMRNLL